MSDETEKTGEKNDGPVGGERLRKARRENDISISDVAKELHLDEFKVRALEKNDFDVLGAPVFAKGHLRKYAELVGVDVDDVMTDYYQMNRSTGVPPVVGLKPNADREINVVPWIVGALVILLLGGLLYWWFGMRAAPQATQEAASLSAPFVDETASAPSQPELPDFQPAAVADPEPPADAESATDAAALPAERETGEPQPIEDEDDRAASTAPAPAEPAVATASEAAYQPTPGAPQVAVTLTFSGDCWTEVSDSSGRRLFYDLGRADRVVNLTGDAPLRLILGDADNVTLSVEGRPWPIPPSARRGQLARLTISAQ